MKKKGRKKIRNDISNKNNKTVILIGIIGIVLLITFYNGYENKKLENFCLSVEQHPDLFYPCKCVPGNKVSNISEDILSKTKPLCTCICEVNGTNMVFPIFKSK